MKGRNIEGVEAVVDSCVHEVLNEEWGKEAAEAAAQAAQSQPKPEESMWQTVAKKFRYEGSTHGRKQQMADLYAAGENGTRTWREVGFEMDRLFHSWQRVEN